MPDYRTTAHHGQITVIRDSKGAILDGGCRTNKCGHTALVHEIPARDWRSGRVSPGARCGVPGCECTTYRP